MGATDLRNKLSKKKATFDSVIGTGSGEIMRIIRKEIEEGRLKAVIDKEFPLEGGKEAIAYLESGHAAGKVVISIQHNE